MKSALLLILAFGLSAGAFGREKRPTVSVMTYNVENLFDTLHDEGKEDYTYMPLAIKKVSQEVQDFCSSIDHDYFREVCFKLDWSEEVLDKKIANLSKVILSAEKFKGPDILVLQEVENKRALEMLVNKGLKNKGYKYISLLEGPDSRGIDVAVISKRPIIKETLHKVELGGVAKETRGILEVEISLGRKTLAVFANHWPSQSNPSQARLIAAQTLAEAAQKSPADAVLAAGDFNTIDADSPHGINLVIKPQFITVHEKAQALGHRVASGSHWYRGEWSFLDKIFFLKGRMQNGIAPLYKSFRVHKESWMLKERIWVDDETGSGSKHMVPNAFDEETGRGFSDHLPLYLELAY